jgi:hypothetical protein
MFVSSYLVEFSVFLTHMKSIFDVFLTHMKSTFDANISQADERKGKSVKYQEVVLCDVSGKRRR